MPRMLVNICAMPAVITTCRHANRPAPEQADGAGYPLKPTGGELIVTLLVKPVVALHGSPLTSNHVAVNPAPTESQALE
jgi:hypothetical protein